MPRLPCISGVRVVKVLERLGFVKRRQSVYSRLASPPLACIRASQHRVCTHVVSRASPLQPQAPLLSFAPFAAFRGS